MKFQEAISVTGHRHAQENIARNALHFAFTVTTWHPTAHRVLDICHFRQVFAADVRCGIAGTLTLRKLLAEVPSTETSPLL